MLTLLIFTNKYVRRFLNKQAKQEIKVVPSEMSIHDFLRGHLEKCTSTPKAITELKTRLLNACGEYENIPENGGSENEGTNVASLEKLKNYLLENSQDGKLVAEKEIEKDLNLTRRQQQFLKSKLLQEGFLYKDNGRFRINSEVMT